VLNCGYNSKKTEPAANCSLNSIMTKDMVRTRTSRPAQDQGLDVQDQRQDWGPKYCP